MKKVQIVYGSNGGNTQLVCEYVHTLLQDQGHVVRLHRCESFDVKELTAGDALIIACPTYEHGSLEPNFEKTLWPQMQGLDLDQHPCVVIGLGDTKYDLDYHIESARILERYVNEHNGHKLHFSLMVSGPPLPLLEKLVKPWCDKLDAKLRDL